MQTSNRLLDDLAKVAGGAASSLAGLKDDAQALVRQQMQRLLDDADLVPRDEFEAVKAVATKARTEQEKLEIRVRALEKQLGGKAKSKSSAKKAKSKAGAKAKPRAKKA
ncbi:MAG: accessory factor UbiK family protein [Rhodospirillaceae bacterium]|jgi:BMFP domain-containing protein YqiC|nr:accessory factor UbiK family protein [Rhodospirillaceae bacterium]MBT4218582.1 accessory factor UbiK family protein [Rhodospirillaceae bacterium]MBT4464510.1 accessory factor UbiK family protein [Rhodospirillaceae bacterium]MBT5013168.1 accessory factor UbiK family protein [Rhodospirillaceae bacterium]MBT5307893.1 accessory factor UbiK family protein [Rhodospirillaceae bacterium]